MEPRLPDNNIDESKVILLTKPNCPKCDSIKEIFAKKQIEYTDMRFSRFEARQLLAKYKVGLGSLPVILYQGQVFNSALKLAATLEQA